MNPIAASLFFAAVTGIVGFTLGSLFASSPPRPRPAHPHTHPEIEALLFGRSGEILAAIHQLGESIMPKIEDISAGVDALKADFETYKTGVDKAIADAVAKATDAEKPALQALADKVAAVDAEIKAAGAVATAPPAVAATVDPATPTA